MAGGLDLFRPSSSTRTTMDTQRQADDNDQTRRKTRVITICGGLNWNMIFTTSRLPEAAETFNSRGLEMMPGGKGANVAVALHRLSHMRPVGAKPPQLNGDLDKIQEQGDSTATKTEADAATGIGPATTPPQNAYDDIEVEVRMIGSVGSDDFGQRMKDSLKQNYINVDSVHSVRGNSAVAAVIVESETGQNRILVYPGANHSLTAKDFLHVSSFGSQRPDLVVSQLELSRDTVKQLITTAKEAGIDTLLNPSPSYWLDDPLYKGLTHLIVNETEAAIMTGKDIEDLDNGFDDWLSVTDEFIDLGVEHVVVTLGARGAFFSEQKGRGELVPAAEVDPERVIDTTGAGDVFVGAYAIQWLKQKEQNKWDMRTTVEYANKASAKIIQCIGSQRAIPWADDLTDSSSATTTD